MGELMRLPRPAAEKLPVETCVAIANARAEKLSYTVRLLASPPTLSEPTRIVVVLGEAHMKLFKASKLGYDLVRRFELRGVEGFQAKDLLLGKLLGKLIHWPRIALRKLSLGWVKDSTIMDARGVAGGHCEMLEKTDKVPLALHIGSAYLTIFFLVSIAAFFSRLVAGWFPGSELMSAQMSLVNWVYVAFQFHLLALIPAWLLRSYRWSVWIHPVIAIVNVRDTLMADGTVRMLREHPGSSPAIVVMGRAHVNGYARELITRYGFRSLDD